MASLLPVFRCSKDIFGINISSRYLFLADKVNHEYFHFYFRMLYSLLFLQLLSTSHQKQVKGRRLISLLQLEGKQNILVREEQPPNQISSQAASTVWKQSDEATALSQAAPTVWKQRMTRLLLQSLFKTLSGQPQPCNGTETFRVCLST